MKVPKGNVYAAISSDIFRSAIMLAHVTPFARGNSIGKKLLAHAELLNHSLTGATE